MLVPVTKPDGSDSSSAGEHAATISTTPISAATRRSMVSMMLLAGPTNPASMSAASFLPQERDVVLTTLFRGLADDRRIRGFDGRDQQLGIDLAAAQVGVPVTP